MRILYFDIDSQRPDHLGCYGYHRDTSPNIDRIAERGVRFDNLYVSDAPCLPSRTSLFSGRFGIHNGVVNHGGAASEPFHEGAGRGFESALSRTSWMRCLRDAGLKTATISPFGERHAAWHWYANFNEVYNTGRGGLERADEIAPIAIDWVRRNGKAGDWFLHVNLWDPHTPYRTPAEFGDPFASEPLPGWLTEEVRRNHWNGCGPHSAREVNGYDTDRTTFGDDYARQPTVIPSMDEVRQMFDGYDTGVLYADHYIGRILDALAEEGLLDETAVIVTADHGENLGELNVYGDHQTADELTCRVPLIVHWPGVTDGQSGQAGRVDRVGRVDMGLHYHFDFAATMIELLGGTVPGNWDGVSFADAFRAGEPAGRDFLVLSQAAWACQRAVRWGDHLAIRSYHDAYHGWPEWMLFNLKDDPHEQHDLGERRPDAVERAGVMLDGWHEEMMRTASHPVDPMRTVLDEGGGLHSRGELPAYLERLRKTGRSHCADRLARQHLQEARGERV